MCSPLSTAPRSAAGRRSRPLRLGGTAPVASEGARAASAPARAWARPAVRAREPQAFAAAQPEAPAAPGQTGARRPSRARATQLEQNLSLRSILSNGTATINAEFDSSLRKRPQPPASGNRSRANGWIPAGFSLGFSLLECRSHRKAELELALRPQVVVQHAGALQVLREDQAERHVQHRHEKPDLGAGRRLERALPAVDLGDRIRQRM